MTSIRKLRANRLNSQASCGPKTMDGKLIASRNALRHGFAATKHTVPIPEADMKRFATALCGKADNNALFEQALIIAESEFVLRAINEQQLAVIERLHDSSACAFSQGHKTLRLMRARVRKRKEAEKAIKALRDALLKKYEGQLADSFADLTHTPLDILFPAHLEEFLEEKERGEVGNSDKGGNCDLRNADSLYKRDEVEALEAAIKDLTRLDRYETRAASRQRRAILAFIGLKTTERFQPAEAKRLSIVNNRLQAAPETPS